MWISGRTEAPISSLLLKLSNGRGGGVITAKLFQSGHALLLETAFTEQCLWIDSGLE